MLKINNTERLKIELMDDSDASLLFELDQDPEVMKHINGGKVSSWDDINNILLPRMNSYRNPEKGWGLWKVTVLETNDFIGWILVRPMDFFTEKRNDLDIELGWRFKRNSWGKGFATEAAQAVMNGLVDLNIYNNMSAIVVSENSSSINVMKKLGMRFQKKGLHKDPLGDLMVEYYTLDLNESH